MEPLHSPCFESYLDFFAPGMQHVLLKVNILLPALEFAAAPRCHGDRCGYPLLAVFQSPWHAFGQSKTYRPIWWVSLTFSLVTEWRRRGGPDGRETGKVLPRCRHCLRKFQTDAEASSPADHHHCYQGRNFSKQVELDRLKLLIVSSISLSSRFLRGFDTLARWSEGFWAFSDPC